MSELTIGRATFSPGPWDVLSRPKDYIQLYTQAYAYEVTAEDTTLPIADVMGDAAEANARLIAAAPDLFDVVQMLCELDGLISHEDIVAGLPIILEHARAAIAKAEGVV